MDGMRVAAAVADGRISPVFDVTRCIRIWDTAEDTFADVDLPDTDQTNRLRLVVDHGVEVLICGAVSRDASEAAHDLGLTIIGFMTGEVDSVLEAWRTGALEDGRYAMPGCRGRRRRRGHGGCGCAGGCERRPRDGAPRKGGG